MDERPAYIPFFEDMFLALDCLEDAELRKALGMFRAYYFDGEEPPAEKGPARAMFLGFKASLDASLRRAQKNRANARRKASQKRPGSQDGANGEPDGSETGDQGATHGSETGANREPNGARREPDATQPQRTRSRAVPRQGQTAATAQPSGGQAGAKPHKTKDQRPKTEDQEEKSVSARVRAPRPLSKFTPPTLEEVAGYGAAFCAENGLPESAFDAGRYLDHFTSNGWKVSGRAAMRDWKASVRNWIRNDYPNLGGGADDDGWGEDYRPAEVTVVE